MRLLADAEVCQASSNTAKEGMGEEMGGGKGKG